MGKSEANPEVERECLLVSSESKYAVSVQLKDN
jgi:hypothetical protein